MAETAADRVYKRKQIDLAGVKIDVPVIYAAKFKCMNEQAQEYWFYFDNSSKSSRKVHVKEITAAAGATNLSVERIDEFHIVDMPSQGQQSTFVLTNHDPPPTQPDGSNNPSHEKFHIVRYFPNNDSESQIWIDVELIDELKIKDTVSQAQEWIYYIRHPELGDVIDDPNVPYAVTKGYCDPSFEIAPDESNLGIDPPWRLDPFQNIINVKRLSWRIKYGWCKVDAGDGSFSGFGYPYADATNSNVWRGISTPDGPVGTYLGKTYFTAEEPQWPPPCGAYYTGGGAGMWCWLGDVAGGGTYTTIPVTSDGYPDIGWSYGDPDLICGEPDTDKYPSSNPPHQGVECYWYVWSIIYVDNGTNFPTDYWIQWLDDDGNVVSEEIWHVANGPYPP